MKYDYISFDLQGTLSDSAFSDEFWLNVLPGIYANSKNIPEPDAKKYLTGFFKKIGKYDLRYYSTGYWLKELDPTLSFSQVTKLFKTKPYIFPDTLKIIKNLRLKTKLIISSSTTYDFINIEMGDEKKYFSNIFSSVDDFSIAGKPKEFYKKIIGILNISPEKIIHIGDDREMDIKNAKSAGIETYFFDRSKSRKKSINDLMRFIDN